MKYILDYKAAIQVLAIMSAGACLAAPPVTEITDGMRSNGGNQLLLVEGAGRLDRVSFEGDTAKIEVLKGGYNGSTAVTKVGNIAWVLEAKLNYMMDPKLKGQDPGPFKIYAVNLKENK